MRARALLLPLLLSAAVPFGARAQDMTPITDRILSDPSFLPLKGQFFGDSTYTYLQGNGDRFDATGAQYADTRNVANELSQYFAYGITDDLSLNFGISGSVSGYHETDNAAGTTHINASGFFDPTFGLTWRAIDQRAHGVNLDLFGHFSPDVFSSHSGSATQDATVARGGGEGDFGAAISQEYRFFTLRGDVTGRYYGSSRTTNSVTGNFSQTSGYWAPELGVQTQVRFAPRFSANAGFRYVFNGDPTVTTPSGLVFRNNVGDEQQVNVSLNYHIIPNRLVGSVNYGHTFFNNSQTVVPSDTALNVTDHRTQDSVGATLRYLF